MTTTDPAHGASAPGDDEMTTGELAADPRLGVTLRLVAGRSGVARPVKHARIQKAGRALAGDLTGVEPWRVQILGEAETIFFDAMTPVAQAEAARELFSLGLSCVVITDDHEPARALLSGAESSGTPLFVSSARSSRTISAIQTLLSDRFAPRTHVSGALVDVSGIGILLIGATGVGKSACALELVTRGHRLVTDDVVECDWRPPGVVFGAPPDLLEPADGAGGLAVQQIKDRFGAGATTGRKCIDIVLRLVRSKDGNGHEVPDGDARQFAILGTAVRALLVPVRAGTDLASIAESVAHNELLRRDEGADANEFMAALQQQLVTRGHLGGAFDPSTNSDGIHGASDEAGAAESGSAPQGERAPAVRWENPARNGKP
jgi:HPr kinase/phosphorylase